MHSPDLYAAGRILVGCMFLYSAGSKLFGFSAMENLMRAYSFPLARLSLVIAILWELGWAAAIIADVKLFDAGLALGAFVLAATAMIHGKDLRDPKRRPLATVHIGNNLMIVGGLLAIAAH